MIVAMDIPGELAIWLALAGTLLAAVAFLLAARGRVSLESLARRSYHTSVLFISVAVGWLYYLFFTHNYAFSYVFNYSERTQPFHYVLSAFWGGQEGTYLLWLFLSALCGYIVIARGGKYREYAMAVICLVNLFFLLILTKVSPFTLLPTPAADGLGLNPLLRDPWMIIHPPVIFAGYALAVVPFSIAMSALFKHDYSEWVKRAFPWAVGCALLLGAGNILGGYWAYKTLGWGGFWGWDPVENSSLVPWVVSLALLHGLVIERRTGALRRINMLFAALLLVLVVYGTFLTRSGILADFSVHSFVDLGTNIYLVGFLIILMVLILTASIWRAGKIQSVPLDYSIYGKQFLLFAAFAVLSVFGVIVLFWSSLPVVTMALAIEPRAADVATYNSFAVPLSVILAFLLAVSPFVRHSNSQLTGVAGRAALFFLAAAAVGFTVAFLLPEAGLMFGIMFTIVAGGIAVFLLKPELRRTLLPALSACPVAIILALNMGVRDYLHLLFFAVATMAVTSNMISLVRCFPERWRSSGSRLAHVGFGVMLIGILASSAFDFNQRLIIPKGEEVEAIDFGLALAYQGMANDIEHPNNELILSLQHGTDTTEARPQLYYSRRLDGLMRRPYINRHMLYDIYLAPEQIRGGEEPESIIMQKGEKRSIRGADLTFVGFEVGEHALSEGQGMTVSALLRLEHEGKVAEAKPSIVHIQDSSGQPQVQVIPDTIKVGDMDLELVIDRIFADQGAVSLRIPQLSPDPSPEHLVIDISKKPLINLVWAGTTLVLIGSLLAFVRRRQQLVNSSAD